MAMYWRLVAFAINLGLLKGSWLTCSWDVSVAFLVLGFRRPLFFVTFTVHVVAFGHMCGDGLRFRCFLDMWNLNFVYLPFT